ncbi:hypothetical protein BME20236_II0518 [Brucella melitensis]|nr:hypothetical protein BME20236_II0518 [Brucella melitensis]
MHRRYRPHLWQQDARACRLACLQCFMGLAGVLESIGLVDLDLDRPAFHDIEKLSSRLFQIGPPGNII